MGWRRALRWVLLTWLGFAMLMVTLAALPWGRHESLWESEVTVILILTVGVLPLMVLQVLRVSPSSARTALNAFVQEGALPPDDATHDALVLYVTAVRREALPYWYLRLVPTPGVLALVGVALAGGGWAFLGLAGVDLVAWLGWVVVFHQRELRLRHMEWLLGLTGMHANVD